MLLKPLSVCAVILALVIPLAAAAQGAAPASEPVPETPASPVAAEGTGISTAAIEPDIHPLLDFRPTDIKFSLPRFMELLQDRTHEGWVLAAYPDPKTGLPLIGAGFSLDLPAREHPQRDPLNPHPFIEPSSAQLWQAAGLSPELREQILAKFDERMDAWDKRLFRRKIKTLEPQITNEEATSLLRIAAIQAIENAKAYCRNFDQLTGPQQMALSHLVYQMGVNLEEFEQFLGLINDGPGTDAAMSNTEYWRATQLSLIQSQWARHYRARAVAVIAMLDPQYLNNPKLAEERVSAILSPPRRHRRKAHRRSSHHSARARRKDA